MQKQSLYTNLYKKSVYCVLLLLVCLFIYSDIDVGVPPGAGYEWVFQMPRVIPSSYRTEVKRGDGHGGGGTTGVAQGLVLDIFSYAKIITVDITNHLQWLKKKQSELYTPQNPNEIYTNSHGEKNLDKYPPKVPKDVMWLALAGFLRNLLHPANATVADSTAYLVFLGDVSREAAEWAQSEPKLRDLVNAVNRLIPEAENVGPQLKTGKNLYETMMLRLTWEDLATAYPFSFEQKFASRLELIGDDAVPFVIEATKSTHLFLKRNATLQLSKYEYDTKALSMLRELFTNSKDHVVRYRALDGLIRAQDKASVSNIIKLLETEENLLKPYLIYSLGMIGDTAAVEPICKILEKNMNSYDILVACVQALGRLKFKPEKGTNMQEDQRVIALLKEAEKKAESYKDPEPGMRPDRPDAPGVFKETIKESVWLALAAMGEKEYLKKFEDFIKKKLEDAKNAGAGTKQIEEKIKALTEELSKLQPNDPRYRQLTREISGLRAQLMKPGKGPTGMEFCQLKTVYFMIDMLSDLNEYDIIKGLIKVAEESVACYALQRYGNKKDGKGIQAYVKDKEFIRSLIAMEGDRSQVTSTALGIYFDVDLTEAQKVAQEILNGYPGNVPTQQAPSGNRYQPAPSPEAKRFVVAFALKLLCDSGKKVDAEKLKSIIENEEKERDKKKSGGGKPGYDPNNPFASRLDSPINIPPAPLLEYAVIELGRLKDPKQENYLISYLKNEKSDARAEACFAVAAIGTKNCKQALVDTLDDKDGWIRFCAYKALKELAKIHESDKDYIADWLYGSDSSRQAAVKKWREWANK